MTNLVQRTAKRISIQVRAPSTRRDVQNVVVVTTPSAGSDIGAREVDAAQQLLCSWVNMQNLASFVRCQPQVPVDVDRHPVRQAVDLVRFEIKHATPVTYTKKIQQS